MLRLTIHIERLLLTQDCVIVPGFGGFVIQAVNASYNAEKSMFVPMSKEVMFNTTLQHNDGLLCESYMQAYHTDYDKAQQMLIQDIEELKSELHSAGEVSLGFIGCFRMGDEGQVVFVPKTTDIMSVYSYGLTSFSIPTLAELEAAERTAVTEERKSAKAHEDVLYIPVSRRFIRTVAASVAAVSLFLVVSTPVRDVNHAAYKASFVPTEMVNYTGVYNNETVVENEVPEMTVSPVIDEPKPEPKPVVAEKTVVAEEKKAPLPQQKMFHIVIASFPDKDQADKFLAKVDRKQFPQTDIIERGGKFRVYSKKFDNRAEAESYLENFRNNSPYKDAWLFISR